MGSPDAAGEGKAGSCGDATADGPAGPRSPGRGPRSLGRAPCSDTTNIARSTSGGSREIACCDSAENACSWPNPGFLWKPENTGTAGSSAIAARGGPCGNRSRPSGLEGTRTAMRGRGGETSNRVIPPLKRFRSSSASISGLRQFIVEHCFRTVRLAPRRTTAASFRA